MSQSTPLREFVRYSALSSCGMIAVSCYILADTFFVAQGLGTAGLAALNLAIPIYNFIHGTGLMLGMGGATKYSIHQSRGDPGGASRMFTGMLLLSVLFSIPFLLLGLFCSHGITVLLGADQAVFEMTRTYLQVLLLFAPATLVNDSAALLRPQRRDPRLSMLATAAGSLANIVLDYIFIFPMGMGIFGAVLATGMSPCWASSSCFLTVSAKRETCAWSPALSPPAPQPLPSPWACPPCWPSCPPPWS